MLGRPRRGLSQTQMEGVRAVGALLPLPAKDIQFSLIWPLVRLAYQASANRILQHIFPLLVVSFVSTQLRIPEITLLNWMLTRTPHFFEARFFQ